MNEQDIFLAAIGIDNPAERASYLDRVCAGNAGLRARLEALLRTHEQTILTGSTDTGEDASTERATRDAEFRKYLEPTGRPGWLGRLAHYEIEEILGHGAFGIVVRAFDEKLQRVVAIKLMKPELALTSPPRKRFLREARSAAAVTHENIVAIHAVEEEPIPYLVMEYMAGQTLQQRMDQCGPLEILEFLQIGQHVAAGLAAAHAANLIHRDIKPSNILLSGGSSLRAKISDFGLARAVDDATLTSSGLIAGTPMYMAPEQARGETLDHRADLFSLGSVLYQMAGGRPPFRAANTVAVLKRVCDDTPRPLHDVLPGTPGWLETIIFRLLEKDRQDRYQTAQEVADLLARCQRELERDGQVTCVEGRSRVAEAHAAGLDHAPQNSAGRMNPVGWLVAGVIAVGAAILFLMMTAGDKTPGPDPTRLSASTTFASVAPTAEVVVNPAPTTGEQSWPADAPPPAIAPFDARQARAHQEAWAKYLDIPVEYENSIGMKLRLLPPSEFLMGIAPEELESLSNAPTSQDWREFLKSEAPQHKVILTQPVYVGVTEVTQTQYERVMGTTPSHFAATGEGKDSVAGRETANHPVEMVSWNDAAEFCARLSRKEKRKPFYSRSGITVTAMNGTGYRLPTEAEWESACRAGTTTRFWSGDAEHDLASAGWFYSNSGGRTHTVGKLKPNPFGLSDVHGNVWEWVEDSWEPKFYRQFTTAAAVNPTSPFLASSQRVVRGGYWNNDSSRCRSSGRNTGPPTRRASTIGFRVVLVAESPRVGRP